MANLNNVILIRVNQQRNNALVGTALLFVTMMSEASISLDRTRIIFNSADTSASVMLQNKSEVLPYLAQSWLENAAGQKVDGPLSALPAIQRIDVGQKSQVRIISLPDIEQLAADRETLFYFNVREIPPKSEVTAAVQIAIQNKIKLFYRPAAIKADYKNVWQEKLQIRQQGEELKIHNPTPYYVTLGHLNRDNRGNFPGFDSVMIAPFGTESVKTPGYNGNGYSLGYMDDFGQMIIRSVNCSISHCRIQAVEKKI
ncbi:molecular chaperone [Yersinia enterocolitica]|uniref:fimbrial biogenesis chaperone n=1 Tax=Yersinia enterocolitica TaxID=630 RepID=UPI002874166E|nr:molecular chaperone [Yersinia enterocolitica]EKN5985411.1 molecular chaperone [Yersinia enterocolitica]EKN5989620.1 molecular chaperone [Yersinia enterocolitica]ELX2241921.1 molecular chaperone [Yersinia enterocolitica]HDL6717730.1 molecular chaperone [Yersinia enterocolitica]